MWRTFDDGLREDVGTGWCSRDTDAASEAVD